MLHRIRETLMERAPQALGGEGCIVETDATIVGGKTKTMNNKKRKAVKGDRNAAMANKTFVTGYVERGGAIRFDVVDKGEFEPDLVRKHIDCGSVLMTDTANTYVTVGKEYAAHEAVDHSKSEYVRGHAHTNTIEGAFSHFDRMVIGVYHNISRKHMQAYANECAYRYNTRKMEQPIRFEDTVLKCSGVRLKYNCLTSK